MNAIEDSKREMDYIAGNAKDYAGNIRRFFLVTALMSLLAILLVLASPPQLALAAGYTPPLKSIAQVTFDDDGLHIGYPLSVFYDPVEQEIYLINSLSNRVVVYGPDFFPRISIGPGRGVIEPRGGFVMPNGTVYVCQLPVWGSKGSIKTPARITILNGAFFLEREIFFNDIPGAKHFLPMHVAVGRDGIIYVVGQGYRGVLVLDNEGNFLRRIQPKDEILLTREPEKQEEAATEETKEPMPQEQTAPIIQGSPSTAEADEGASSNDISLPDIPEEFRPRKGGQKEDFEPRIGIGPVQVNFVTLDSNGRIYLLSAEAGKVYVYGPDETFLFSFGKKGGSPRQMSQPRGLAIDEKKKVIYIVDYMRHTILAYNMQGKYLFEIGGRGNGPGWFNFPVDIAINQKGQIIVADMFNKRVQVLEVEYDPSATYWIESSDESKPETAPDSEKEITPDEGSAEPSQNDETKAAPDGESNSAASAPDVVPFQNGTVEEENTEGK